MATRRTLAAEREKAEAQDRPQDGLAFDPGTLAQDIGRRIRRARRSAGLTQQELAGARYTKAYISALENGHSKPSMAALSFIAGRLGLPAVRLLEDEPRRWSRISADLELAAGHWQAALDAYRGLLDDPLDRGSRAEILLGSAEASVGLDLGVDAVAAAAEAQRTFVDLGRAADAALAGYWLAAGEYLQGHTPEARAIYQQLLTRVRGGLRVEPDFEARILMALSSNAAEDGDHESALSYLAELRHRVDELDARRRGVYYFDLSHSYREIGDYEAAIRAGLTGLALLRAANLEFEWAGLLNGLGRSYLALGNTAKAEAAIREARAAFERLGDPRWLANATEAEAELRLAQGDHGLAAQLAADALGRFETIADEKGALDALVTLARARRQGGPTGEVLELYARAAELAKRSGRPARIREVLGLYADALAEIGEHERAFDVARAALRAG